MAHKSSSEQQKAAGWKGGDRLPAIQDYAFSRLKDRGTGRYSLKSLSTHLEEAHFEPNPRRDKPLLLQVLRRIRDDPDQDEKTRAGAHAMLQQVHEETNAKKARDVFFQQRPPPKGQSSVFTDCAIYIQPEGRWPGGPLDREGRRSRSAVRSRRQADGRRESSCPSKRTPGFGGSSSSKSSGFGQGVRASGVPLSSHPFKDDDDVAEKSRSLSSQRFQEAPAPRRSHFHPKLANTGSGPLLAKQLLPSPSRSPFQEAVLSDLEANQQQGCTSDQAVRLRKEPYKEGHKTGVRGFSKCGPEKREEKGTSSEPKSPQAVCSESPEKTPETGFQSANALSKLLLNDIQAGKLKGVIPDDVYSSLDSICKIGSPIMDKKVEQDPAEAVSPISESIPIQPLEPEVQLGSDHESTPVETRISRKRRLDEGAAVEERASKERRRTSDALRFLTERIWFAQDSLQKALNGEKKPIVSSLDAPAIRRPPGVEPRSSTPTSILHTEASLYNAASNADLGPSTATTSTVPESSPEAPVPSSGTQAPALRESSKAEKQDEARSKARIVEPLGSKRSGLNRDESICGDQEMKKISTEASAKAAELTAPSPSIRPPISTNLAKLESSLPHAAVESPNTEQADSSIKVSSRQAQVPFHLSQLATLRRKLAVVKQKEEALSSNLAQMLGKAPLEDPLSSSKIANEPVKQTRKILLAAEAGLPSLQQGEGSNQLENAARQGAPKQRKRWGFGDLKPEPLFESFASALEEESVSSLEAGKSGELEQASCEEARKTFAAESLKKSLQHVEAFGSDEEIECGDEKEESNAARSAIRYNDADLNKNELDLSLAHLVAELAQAVEVIEGGKSRAWLVPEQAESLELFRELKGKKSSPEKTETAKPVSVSQLLKQDEEETHEQEPEVKHDECKQLVKEDSAAGVQRPEAEEQIPDVIKPGERLVFSDGGALFKDEQDQGLYASFDERFLNQIQGYSDRTFGQEPARESLENYFLEHRASPTGVGVNPLLGRCPLFENPSQSEVTESTPADWVFKRELLQYDPILSQSAPAEFDVEKLYKFAEGDEEDSENGIEQSKNENGESENKNEESENEEKEDEEKESGDGMNDNGELGSWDWNKSGDMQSSKEGGLFGSLLDAPAERELGDLHAYGKFGEGTAKNSKERAVHFGIGSQLLQVEEEPLEWDDDMDISGYGMQNCEADEEEETAESGIRHFAVVREATNVAGSHVQAVEQDKSDLAGEKLRPGANGGAQKERQSIRQAETAVQAEGPSESEESADAPGSKEPAEESGDAVVATNDVMQGFDRLN